ncbi:MAG: hypothetical protein ACXVAX_12360 [Pseudobdellovibrio sp.]
MKRIAVIGNPCSGKTTFSRDLKKKYSLPLFHIDSIQFLEGMKLRDPAETREKLLEISNRSEWIIDGLGPLKIIEDRFQKSDLVICIRIPLVLNFWFMVKRQLKALFIRREELPPGNFEATPLQTYRLIKNIWNVQHGLWKQLDRIFLNEIYKDKVIYLKSVREMSEFLK